LETNTPKVDHLPAPHVPPYSINHERITNNNHLKGEEKICLKPNRKCNKCNSLAKKKKGEKTPPSADNADLMRVDVSTFPRKLRARERRSYEDGSNGRMLHRKGVILKMLTAD